MSNEFMNIIINNGLGIASFFALIMFMTTYLKEMNQTLKQISTTLVLVEKNLSSLTNRVDDIENKIKK